VATELRSITGASPGSRLASFIVPVDSGRTTEVDSTISPPVGLYEGSSRWVALTWRSRLLAGGKLGDLIGRRTTFLAGLAGFAGVSAVGGASTNFATLVAARALDLISQRLRPHLIHAYRMLQSRCLGRRLVQPAARYASTAAASRSRAAVVTRLCLSHR
jgi:MFS family permease